jgi:hypothetical protein
VNLTSHSNFDGLHSIYSLEKLLTVDDYFRAFEPHAYALMLDPAKAMADEDKRARDYAKTYNLPCEERAGMIALPFVAMKHIYP